MAKQIRVYVSHSIRGRKGNKATQEDQEHAVSLAIIFGQALRRKFPGVDFYVPGDHEFPPIGYLLRKGYATIKQVLDVDCEIVSESNFVIAFSPDGYISRGMRIEIEFAGGKGIPVIIVSKLDRKGMAIINRQIRNCMR